MKSKFQPTRRELLTGTVRLAAGAWLFSQAGNVFAQDKTLPPDRFFIMLIASGGAHSPLGLDGLLLKDLRRRKLDPIDTSDPDEFFSCYRDEELRQTPAGRFLGPAGRPLEAIINDVAIVNGIMMLPNDVGHGSNLEFMTNGSIKSRIAFPHQLDPYLAPAHYGTLSNQSLEGRGISSGGMRDGAPLKEYINLFKAQAAAVPAKTDLQTAQRSVVQTAEQFARYQSLFRNYSGSASREWLAHAAAGFQTGLLNSAVISLEEGRLDTHSDHAEEHPRALSAQFEEVATMVRFLKNTQYRDTPFSLYDVTTFIHLTEFSRSAAREGRSGTDHNPWNNSCLIGGCGIQGGQVAGASTIIAPSRTVNRTSLLHALPFNHDTGQNLRYEDFAKYIAGEIPGTVDYIFPKDVYQTLVKAMGLNAQPEGALSGRPLKALLKA
ncbi:MAG: DUF1501 domain-containing protein [Bdellovibrionales bacterium]